MIYPQPLVKHGRGARENNGAADKILVSDRMMDVRSHALHTILKIFSM